MCYNLCDMERERERSKRRFDNSSQSANIVFLQISRKVKTQLSLQLLQAKETIQMKVICQNLELTPLW